MHLGRCQNYHLCRIIAIYYIGTDVKNKIFSAYITEFYLLLVHLMHVLLKLAHRLSEIWRQNVGMKQVAHSDSTCVKHNLKYFVAMAIWRPRFVHP